MKKIIIIGGGASGIMSAVTAKKQDNEVIIIEKNKTLGQKLSITGSSRCNITNIDDSDSFFNNIMENAKFFYSAFSKFSNYNFISYLESIGIKLKYENQRVYPYHESAQKLVNTFIKILEEKDVKVFTQEEMIDIDIKNEMLASITTNRRKYLYGRDFTDIILATGGLSYTTNRTFSILKNKIKLTKFYPSLTSVQTVKNYSILAGISLQNVGISTTIDKKTYNSVGDILFTQKGMTGPAILDITGYIVKYQDRYINISEYEQNKSEEPIIYKGQDVCLEIDFLKNLSSEQLETILFDSRKKQLKTKLSEYMPSKFAKYLLEKYDNVDIFNLKKEEKDKIISIIKKHKIQIKKYGDIKSAIITKGGIDINIINPKNMRCKCVDNLYFAGECIDIDALEGGYNLQIAFSTGYVAGSSCIIEDNN